MTMFAIGLLAVMRQLSILELPKFSNPTVCTDCLCGSTVVDLSNVDYVIWTTTRRASSSDCVMSRQLIFLTSITLYMYLRLRFRKGNKWAF